MLLNIIEKKVEEFRVEQELIPSHVIKESDNSQDYTPEITFDFIALVRQENAPDTNTNVPLISILENNLKCVVEQYSVVADIPNPCGTGVINCPVYLNKFKYVGSIKVALNIPLKCTKSPYYQYFSDYVLIDSVRCYTSSDDSGSCPTSIEEFVKVDSIKVITTTVGNTQTFGYVPVTMRLTLSLTNPCTLPDILKANIEETVKSS